MIKDLLKNKLMSIGYIGDAVYSRIDEMDYNLLSSKKDFSEKDIEIVNYDVPSVEIERAIINVDDKYLQTKVIDGEIELKTIQLPTGGSMTLIDYFLDKRLCIVSITSDLRIEIILYSPSGNYNSKKYNDVYSEDRNSIIQDYLNEFVSGNRLLANKANEVLNMLANDFVIDEMIVNNTIPVFRLYNSPDSFSDKITNYELKYINRRLNKIEIAEKSVLVKRTSKNVRVGFLSNDPYLKISEFNKYSDFYLNNIAYFWLYSNEKGVEEIGIYTAPRNEHILYSEFILSSNVNFMEKSKEICSQFNNQLGFPINEGAIKEMLVKLNHQLVLPPIDLILKYAENPSDPIEPLSYRYKAIIDAAEFESRLYNSIEDNMGRRYKFKLTENVLQDLTTIGNKLDYTTSDGNKIKKQSIADFNQNGNAVIIRRETLIDESNIPNLLGYIYEDIEGDGTDNLPVPSIEVDFYFANPGFARDGIKMYNGTSYESMADATLSSSKFYDIEAINELYLNSMPAVEGSTKVRVKYVASSGDILRENVIKNVFPGNAYIPDILPIITDKSGKEWECKVTSVPRLILSDIEDNNIIELNYEKKLAKVKFNFTNMEGKVLSSSNSLDMQVGEEINIKEYDKVIDNDGVEWNLVSTRLNKLIVSEDEKENIFTFVYDVTKVDVKINYLKKDGGKLKDASTVKAVADKKYTAEIEPILEDESGRAWVYISDSAATITPQENENNIINLVYDELKAKVTTKFENVDGISVKDDAVEFIQVGKSFMATYNTTLTDESNRLWKYDSINKTTMIVKQNESENIIKVIYRPEMSTVTIKIISEKGKSLVDDVEERIQVGTIYAAEAHDRIKDKKGRVWKSKAHESIEINEDPKKNVLSLIYEPLIVNLVVKYLDDESRDIIPAKEDMLQAGDIYKPELPSKLEDSDGRRWKFIASNDKEFIVNELEADNKFSIYYEKELTDITLSFKDLYSNTLNDDVTIKWQIGAKYESNAYEKIKDKTGARWSVVSSEPKTMIVKEKNNHFILIYDEIRTKVVIRYINIDDNTAIKEPDIVTAKLGTLYVPNILHEFIDHSRRNWTYVGEKEISITTQEEEQDNIIVLKYEPHRAKVVVKYIDSNGNSIANDNVKDIQVGSEVQIKRIEKLYSENKLGYSLIEMSNSTIRVAIEEEKNIITCIYEPLLGTIITSYRNKDGLEIIKPISNKIQVGKKFTAEIIDKVIDEKGKYWNYNGEDELGVVASEEEQTLILQYEPEMKKVSVQFVDLDGIMILPTLEELIQVGERYIPKLEELVKDNEGKVWKYVSVDKRDIIVSEDETDNVITIRHDKKLVDVVISFINPSNNFIKSNESMKLQLGSTINYKDNTTIIDRDGYGWEVAISENAFKIEKETNNFTIQYIPYLVDVYDRFLNEENEDIIAPVSSKHQVGTKYTPNIKEVLIDLDDREWLHVDNKLLGKSSTIKVSQDERKNDAEIRYKPSMTDVTVEYVDPLGAHIKADDVVKAQIGSIFSADVIERITDTKKKKWTYNPNTNNSVKVKREGTVITLSYEEQKAVVIYKYEDEYGNRLQAPKKTLVQVGTTHVPNVDQIVEDEQERVWEYKQRNIESIEIKDTEQDNVFVMIYVPLKVDVKLFIKDNIGKELLKPVNVKAQLGSEFKPNIDNSITDDESLMYKFVKVEPEIIKVRETPIGSAENVNVFNLIYEPVYSMAFVKYQDIDGNTLRDDEKYQLQVGTKFTPKRPQFIKDRKENQWEILTNEDITLRVMENQKENVVKFVYEIANADVFIRYKNADGNIIKEEEKINLQIGTEFIPSPQKYIYDSENRKWSYFSCDPVRLRVGSIGNVINMLYQEEKSAVIVKFVDKNGKKLKADEKVMVQIGSVFKPNVKNKVIYDENEIWRFSHFEPKEILISENSNENIISQIYTNNEIEQEIDSVEKQNVQGNELIDSNENTTENTQQTSDAKVSENANSSVTSEQVQKGYVYKNPSMERIDKVTLLNDNEKIAADKINILNNNMISELYSNSGDIDNTIANLEKLFDEEKEVVNTGLIDILNNDRTGSKFLRILEISLEPVTDDKIFNVLQQRKAVAMTDYFMNNPLTDSDQALYILLKGKNEKQIQIVKNNSGTEKEIIMQLVYEKLLLENYYRARSEIKDKYFLDESAKSQISVEIGTIVNNMLINQTYNLLVKDNANSYQQLELKALYGILNQMQKDSLLQKINKISDGKQRKNLTKKMQAL